MKNSMIAKSILTVLALALAMTWTAPPAAAVPVNQVLKLLPDRTITGKCCFAWDESVSITEPAVVAPVVVMFSTDYSESGSFVVKLSVNNRPCQAFGPSELDFETDGQPRSHAFGWIVYPEDGLMRGANTFTLCGGTISGNENPTLVIGHRTLSVTISK